jgi:hypothetical protein
MQVMREHKANVLKLDSHVVEYIAVFLIIRQVVHSFKAGE